MKKEVIRLTLHEGYVRLEVFAAIVSMVAFIVLNLLDLEFVYLEAISVAVGLSVFAVELCSLGLQVSFLKELFVTKNEQLEEVAICGKHISIFFAVVAVVFGVVVICTPLPLILFVLFSGFFSPILNSIL